MSSTSVVNCAWAPHGLWTASDIGGGSCSNYFDIQSGSTLTIFNDDADSANWTARLLATAKNPQLKTATIDLTFTNLAASHSSYKQEGGLLYDPANVDFFLNVLGTITIDGGTPYDIDEFKGSYGFQYGLGANAKSQTEFGGSAWIQTCNDGAAAGTQCVSSDHWDLNLKLTEVPEPATALLLGLGLLSLGRIRRQS